MVLFFRALPRSRFGQAIIFSKWDRDVLKIDDITKRIVISHIKHPLKNRWSLLFWDFCCIPFFRKKPFLPTKLTYPSNKILVERRPFPFEMVSFQVTLDIGSFWGASTPPKKEKDFTTFPESVSLIPKSWSFCGDFFPLLNRGLCMDLDGSSSDFSFHDTGFSVSLARIHQCCTSGHVPGSKSSDHWWSDRWVLCNPLIK